MSQITYRANLSAAIFPLSLAQAGRSVIVPGPDNVYDRRVDPEGEQKNAGIPQAIYLENVIPTANGYQSVGFTTVESSAILGYQTFDVILALRPGDQVNYMSVLYKAPNFFKSSSIKGLGNWTDMVFVGTPAYPTAGRITSAVVRGICYALIRGATNELYTVVHNGAAVVFTNITASLTGVIIADITEICGSFNYLILVDRLGGVQWSSTTTPTDFVISLVTGAGSASPNGSLSNISNIEAIALGFYLTTKAGILFAQYTGNSRYPWRFIPVTDTTEVIAFNSFGFNSNGIFSIDSVSGISRAEGANITKIAPELASYLRAQSFADFYNYSNNALTKVATLSTTRPKLYFFHGRYVCVSCDSVVPNSFESVIIYDTNLKRYGKLKISHQFLAPYNTTVAEITNLKFGAIHLTTGICKVVEFDVDDAAASHQSVLILGKFQYVRSRHLQLHSATIEGTLVSASQVLIPSLDGKTFDAPIAPYVEKSTPDILSCLYRAEAKNHSLTIKGQFAVESVELVFTSTSSR